MITVFTTKSTENELKELLKEQYNTFEPMRSENYEMKISNLIKDFVVFTFTQCDCAPTNAYHVALNNNRIWVDKIAHEISKILLNAKINFSVSYKKYPPITIS